MAINISFYTKTRTGIEIDYDGEIKCVVDDTILLELMEHLDPGAILDKIGWGAASEHFSEQIEELKNED